MEEKTVRAKVQEQRRGVVNICAKVGQLQPHVCACGTLQKINTLRKEKAKTRQHKPGRGRLESEGLGEWGLSSMTITDSDTITHGHVLPYAVVVPDTYRFTQELTV